jgi:predicted DNA-binding transcriptional regulator YafY
MKSQRLLAITMLLLNRDCISAPELARRFEVSPRTIYRDIESLCKAGIPIVAYPGSGGGFGIMGEFKIDRSLMRPEEIGQISATLSSLSSALGDARMSQTVDRLGALRTRARTPKGNIAGHPGPENYIFVELAPAAREREKIAKLRRSIEEKRLSRFDYVDAGGRTSSRTVEPMALVFIWQAWYLYAYCRCRDAFRLFKIARILSLDILPERFAPRAVDLDARPWNKDWAATSPFLPTSIRFFDAVRIEEHFDPEAIDVEPGGSAIVRTQLPADEWAVSFLLGLGIPFEVLEPEELRRFVAARAADLLGRNKS